MLSNYATTIAVIDGYTTITYHSTPIVRFNDREIILDTGGYNTRTTVKKMNQAAQQFNLGYQVKAGRVTYRGEVVDLNFGVTLNR